MAALQLNTNNSLRVDTARKHSSAVNVNDAASPNKNMKTIDEGDAAARRSSGSARRGPRLDARDDGDPALAHFYGTVAESVALSEGMSKVGSDEWNNFVVIDDGPHDQEERGVENLSPRLPPPRLACRTPNVSPVNSTDLASGSETFDNANLMDDPKVTNMKEVRRLLGLPRHDSMERNLHHRKQGNILSSHTKQKLRELMRHEGETVPELKVSLTFSADGFPWDKRVSRPSLDATYLGDESTAGGKEDPASLQNRDKNILMEGQCRRLVPLWDTLQRRRLHLPSVP